MFDVVESDTLNNSLRNDMVSSEMLKIVPCEEMRSAHA